MMMMIIIIILALSIVVVEQQCPWMQPLAYGTRVYKQTSKQTQA